MTLLKKLSFIINFCCIEFLCKSPYESFVPDIRGQRFYNNEGYILNKFRVTPSIDDDKPYTTPTVKAKIANLAQQQRLKRKHYFFKKFP